MTLESIMTMLGAITTPLITALLWFKKTIKRENEEYTDAKVDPIIENLNKNEKDRLRYIILKFANKLRKGEKFSITAFRSTFDDYDKYHSLGGNGYVETEMEYIRACYTRDHNEEVS